MNEYNKPQNLGPFRIRDLKNGYYQIHSKKYGAYEGSLRSISRQALVWGIPSTDLKYALSALSDGNDYADFGVFGGFLYAKRNKRGA